MAIDPEDETTENPTKAPCRVVSSFVTARARGCAAGCVWAAGAAQRGVARHSGMSLSALAQQARRPSPFPRRGADARALTLPGSSRWSVMTGPSGAARHVGNCQRLDQGGGRARLCTDALHVLHIEVSRIEHVPRAKMPIRVPVVLSREEVVALVRHLEGTLWIIVALSAHRPGNDCHCGRPRELELQAHREVGEDPAVQRRQRRIGVPTLDHPLSKGGHDPRRHQGFTPSRRFERSVIASRAGSRASRQTRSSRSIGPQARQPCVTPQTVRSFAVDGPAKLGLQPTAARAIRGPPRLKPRR